MSKHRTGRPRTAVGGVFARGAAARTAPWPGPGRTGPPPRRRRSGVPGLRQPVALAVVGRAADFERLRRHRLFAGADHGGYLRRTESQLRTLRGGGLDVHLRLLDAAGFEEYCAAHLLDPGDPSARVAYAADPEFSGEPFVYAGQGLAELLPALVADHLARARISAAGAELLAALEHDPRAGRRLEELLGYAAEVCLAVAVGAGEGAHRLVLTCPGQVGVGEDGAGQGGAVEVEIHAEGGRLAMAGRDAEAFCLTLAAALAVGGSGRLLLYGDVVRSWALGGGRLRPMTPAELRSLPSGFPARPGFALPEQPDHGPVPGRGS